MVGYIVSLTIFTAIYALFGLGLNLQWGFTGLINFGHVAFMTVGAYTTVLLSSAGVPILVSVLVGAVCASLLGLLIGISTLRLREDYLAIVTIGVSELIRLIALNEEWLTRGAFGVQNYPLPLANFRPTLFSKGIMISILTVVFGLALWQLWQWTRRQLQQKPESQISSWSIFTMISLLTLLLWAICSLSISNYGDNPSRNGLMFLSLVVLALMFWRLEGLVRSPWGRVLKAIREDEAVAKSLGKNVFWYKLQSLMLGGFIAGIAGAFFAWQLSTVYPNNFEPIFTFNAWTIVVLGGAGNNVGTLLGAAIFWTYTAVTRSTWLQTILPLDEAQFGAFRIMLIGLILIIVMMWRPQGILGKKEELTLGR